ncbi:hypothetical protein PGT21_001708 [Puccinia graminis f. sp. tritici]|uniref:Uncharacterized protein n=1 Tax=Puccinia graminis f. sp. tritici TaxID=56615 RepID=A0A5B0MBC9_PUCGR|nr:hypothetical protein PGT21_001708 [Puccinia graminis f. sp. tritici]
MYLPTAVKLKSVRVRIFAARAVRSPQSRRRVAVWASSYPRILESSRRAPYCRTHGKTRSTKSDRQSDSSLKHKAPRRVLKESSYNPRQSETKPASSSMIDPSNIEPSRKELDVRSVRFDSKPPDDILKHTPRRLFSSCPHRS